MATASPGHSLCIWLTGSSEVYMTPSLGVINLVEWLTELRETIYLLDNWFTIKDITQAQADGRDE